jgi:hypothetical protein
VPIIKDDSIWAAVYESTEGTFAGPASATDGYIQARMDGTALDGTQEVKERNIFTGTLIAANPRIGMSGVSGSLSAEAKASGTEGAAVDYDIMLESILPGLTTISTTTTTKASGNTGSVLQIEDADISKFTVNDIIVVKQTAGHHPAVITAKTTGVGTATITISPAKASGSFSNSVVISKSKTYKPADSGHKSYSVSNYLANAVRQSGLGCRTTGVKLANFTTGELPSFDFSFEGMTFSTTASTAASHTPTFDSSLPSVVLNSRIYKDGTSIAIEGIDMSIEQPVKFLMATSSANGKTAGRAAGKRKVTGSFAPYTDETSVATFTAWAAGTTFSLFAFTAVPSGTAGEYTMGTFVCIYLPKCFTTSVKYADADGVVTEAIEFMATGGDTGSTDEVIIGFI